MNRAKMAFLGATILIGLHVSAAVADMSVQTYGFINVTNNSPASVLIGIQQLRLEVSNPVAGQVLFNFKNLGPQPCAIAQVYFDWPTGLLSLNSIVNGPGVAFVAGGSPPNLPGWNTLTPAFVADSRAKFQQNVHDGVDPYEYLQINMNLLGTSTFADVIRDLDDESLRVGLHIQAYANGESESYVDKIEHKVVPAPGAALLGLIGLGSVKLVRRRAKR